MSRPVSNWPRGRMAVPRVDEESPHFYKGLVVGLSLTFAVAGVAFAIWAFVSNH